MNAHNEELLDRIVSLARGDDGVRALALVGSSSREDGRNDEYSDIDVILVTDSPERYLSSAGWAEAVGRVWFSFSESVPEANHHERRFLFAGGHDVDAIVIEAGRLKTSPESLWIAREICAGGIRVILDKDGLSSALLGLAGGSRGFSFPSKADFGNLVHDFCFHYLWAMKKCLRGEYWVALQCVNGYLKRKTLAMLEWYERAVHGPDYDTRYDGRYLELWIDPDLRDDLERSFSPYGREGILDALDASLRLFAKAARVTASTLRFSFPEDEISELEAHGKRLRG